MRLQKIEHEKVLEALNWNLDKIKARYMKDYGINSDDADLMERELKRFLIVCADCSDGKIGMTGPVDDIWHTFIIFTNEYEKFCHKLNGGLIHHMPVDDTDEDNSTKGEPTAYKKFLILYEKIFEEKPDGRVWPQEKTLAGCLKCQRCLRCLSCQSL